MSTLILLVVALAAASDKKVEVPSEVKDILRSSSRKLDKCVARYTEKHPEERGSVSIRTTHGKDGRAKDSKLTTKLPQAHDLVRCLRRVAEGFRLPTLKEEGTLAIVVPVHKGAKFNIDRKPQKKPTATSEDERPLGDFTFQPGGFVNKQWEAPDGTGQPSPSDDGEVGKEEEPKRKPPEVSGPKVETGGDLQ